MALLKAVQVAAKYPVPSAAGGVEVIAIVGDYTIKTGDAAGDIIEMVPLPAGYVPVDHLVDNQSLAATSVGDVGILSGNYGESGARTMGAEFNSGANFATAGIKRPDVAGAGRIAPTTNDRSIGIKLTSLTTPVIGAKVRLTLFARAQSWGV
jgi:hypothetical protein